MDCMRVNSPLKRLSLLQISRIHMGAFWRWHRDLQILSACYRTLKLLGKEISWKENHNSCHIYLQLCFYPITKMKSPILTWHHVIVASIPVWLHYLWNFIQRCCLMLFFSDYERMTSYLVQSGKDADISWFSLYICTAM